MQEKENTVLFIGRFQPLHKGHVKAICELLKKYDKVILAIGSIQEKRTFQNPFSFTERKKMIRSVFLNEIEEGKIMVGGVKDEFDDEKWTEKILRRFNFDVVATANPWVEKCFSGKKPVEKIKLWKPELYSGTRIRELMLSGSEEWKRLVPEEVKNIIISLLPKILKETKIKPLKRCVK